MCTNAVMHTNKVIFTQNRLSRQWGASLVELIVFMVVVSTALAAVIGVYNQSVANSVNPIDQTRALECAQAKMDEILARKFDENTPTGGIPACNSFDAEGVTCAGTADADFDDVLDYHNSTDNSATRCSTAVTVVDAGADLGLAGDGARLITVTATASGGAQTVLSAYKANF
ncbi:type II secretion system protein [Marinibactrum halimedae]|uniref:Type II secretion system protein n=1 Tax=Marinibactrum halimedae TaxID=1444977 RepID=A0AA37WM23_9GAMM|nr:type II secretion system protein [Marinibactrum halimedae]MCD9460817.1 type II secretion system protein [Marinibactrum halimedae]GLS26719.1 hypothetical protein GCM10007877_24360 [Marinibactrum halimedae]